MNYFNAEEIERLEARSETTKYRLFLRLGYILGLRISEILGLKFSDIEGSTIWLRHRKGGKRQMLPCPEAVLDLVIFYRVQRRAEAHDWIFAGKDPLKPLSSRAAQKYFTKLCLRAGIDRKVSVHTLRHTFATEMVNAGVNIYDLKELMGHSWIATTAKYLHTNHERLKKAHELRKKYLADSNQKSAHSS